jgi:hypothetical protein
MSALCQKQTSTLCSGRIAASQRVDALETVMTTIALPFRWFIGIAKLKRSAKPINDTLGFRQIERALCPEDRTNDGVGPA